MILVLGPDDPKLYWLNGVFHLRTKNLEKCMKIPLVCHTEYHMSHGRTFLSESSRLSRGKSVSGVPDKA